MMKQALAAAALGLCLLGGAFSSFAGAAGSSFAGAEDSVHLSAALPGTIPGAFPAAYPHIFFSAAPAPLSSALSAPISNTLSVSLSSPLSVPLSLSISLSSALSAPTSNTSSTPLSSMAAASDLLKSIARRLEVRGDAGAGYSGEFRQERHARYAERPLVSTGHFSVLPGEGLRWRVVAPAESLMTVSGADVRLNGEPMRDFGAGALLARVMRGFMRGDLAELAEGFQVAGDAAGAQWRVELTPAPAPGRTRAARAARVIERIVAAGDAYLERIEIVEKNGNRTVVVFHNMQRESSSDFDDSSSPGNSSDSSNSGASGDSTTSGDFGGAGDTGDPGNTGSPGDSINTDVSGNKL